MSGEDQERFEDYLELEHHIEELQAGRVAHPPAELTPSQASIYRMAALFRSSLPEANEPRPRVPIPPLKPNKSSLSDLAFRDVHC